VVVAQAREFSASCLERHASGSPSHEEASKAVFKDFESYVLVVAEKHFREGKRFDGSDNDAETSDTEAEKPADDSNPFSGMEGARDVTAARQVIDFFAGMHFCGCDVDVSNVAASQPIARQHAWVQAW